MQSLTKMEVGERKFDMGDGTWQIFAVTYYTTVDWKNCGIRFLAKRI